MTVSNENLSPDQYDGNDVTTEFPITFDFVDQDHIVVTSVDSDNVETLGTRDGEEDYDYTIDEELSPTTVTMNAAPATGVTLVIDCVTPLTQTTDLKRNRAAGAEVYEAALDKLTLLVRDKAAMIARSLVLPATADTGIDTTLPLPSAGGVLGWNDDEDALENIFSLDGYVISSFAETLLDDDDAEAARDTLELGVSDNPQFERLQVLGLNDGTYNIDLPTEGMAAAKFMLGNSSTILWMYLNTAPPGWKALATGADTVLGISGGSAAYNVNGGNSGGSFIISIANMPEHDHPAGGDNTMNCALGAITGFKMSGLTSTTGNTGGGDGLYRPAASVGKLFQLDTP